MSTVVPTEAHRALRKAVTDLYHYPHLLKKADQLIAESEARAHAANHHELNEARSAERLARMQLDLARAELAKERARFVRFITLADTWQQGINDTQRVIDNPEACQRAGVLEINRLRTVNDVRRDMLKDLIGTTKEDGK